MELDDLKSTWQTLNESFARQQELTLRQTLDHKLDGIQRGLRPLKRGQMLQIACGALLALWGGGFWADHRQSLHLLVTGVLFHVYGVALIAFGAHLLLRLSGLDFGGPVLEIQRSLAELSDARGQAGRWLGLPWWVLWLPFLEMACVSLAGVDLFHQTVRLYLPLTLAVGLMGWGATRLFLAWALRRPTLAPRVRAALDGRRLTRAKAALEEIASFEREDGQA